MINIKQVIVMRKDLNMRKGKMVAQGAHASVNVLLEFWKIEKCLISKKIDYRSFEAMNNWLVSGSKKICLGVNSEKELIEIYKKSEAEGIICSLVQDSGLTEFNNIPTLTCCAIGPFFDDEIDKIAGSLSLL